MRSIVAVALAALLAVTLAPVEALAQSGPGAYVNPRGPIPYSELSKRRAATRPTARPSEAPSAIPGSVLRGPDAQTVSASGARLGAAEPLPPAELEAYVDGLVKDAMAREHIAGVTVSIVQNGQVVLKKGYGFASLNPARRVNADTTLFRVGSISKTFTWIALMKEVDAGKIRIDGPINLYLPEQLQVRDQGFRAPVQVRHLMDHSAGFEDRALGHLFERDQARERPLAEYLRQERPRRVRGPGEISSYSNYGAGLAGEAVSYVTGKPFPRLIEDEILIPAGMNHTTFREPHAARRDLPLPMPERLTPLVSEGFRWTPGGYRSRPFEYISHIGPAGSASSTAGDMARYMQLLLNGGTLDNAVIYGPGVARAFQTDLRVNPRGINGWRHGFMEYGLPGELSGFGHPGATLSFMSNMVVVPQLGLGIFISTNTETGRALTDRFPGEVIQQFYASQRSFPRAGSAELRSRAKVFEGYYVGSRRAYRGLESFIGLITSGTRVTVTPEGRLVTTGVDGVHTWVPDGPLSRGVFIATEGPERLAFSVSDGKARSFQAAAGAQTSERTGFWRKPTTISTLAILAGLASAATIAGLFLRNRREFRQTSIQQQASLVQTSQAALWLTSIGLFSIWAMKTSDTANVIYGWPGATLIIASACAFVSALLSILAIIILPAVWRGGRRVDSWNQSRKAAYSWTAILYLIFSVTLGFWGALTPWHS